jgi:hypothetical protein
MAKELQFIARCIPRWTVSRQNGPRPIRHYAIHPRSWFSANDASTLGFAAEMRGLSPAAAQHGVMVKNCCVDNLEMCGSFSGWNAPHVVVRATRWYTRALRGID